MEIFVDICNNIGSVPILLTQPRLASENNSESEKKRIAYGYTIFDHNTLVDAFNKCDSIIFDVANSRNVDVIDLSKYFSGKSELFVDHGHTTKLGSKLIAEKTANYLKEIINWE